MELNKATLVAEEIISLRGAPLPAIRVIPHDENGKKPTGKRGKGVLIVANEGEGFSDVLRTVAGLLDQEGDWESLIALRIGAA